MVKFTNTDWFTQIDWNKEIANQKPVSSEAQAKRAETAAFVWTLAKSNIEAKASSDKNTKANVMRMHEYFYAKFLYHHELFYKRDCDVVKTVKEYRREEHPIVALRKQFGKLPKSRLPLSSIKPVEIALRKHVEDMYKKNKEQDGGYAEVKKLVEQEGLKCVRPKGLGKEGDRDTVCTLHDGVRYHISLMKRKEDRTPAKAKQECEDHKRMVDRYHPLVKRIYEKIKTFKNVGDVWAMEGGGMQCQVFFGNETGYLAILYLDMKKTNSKKFDKTYTLQVNRQKNDHLFENFNVEGVTVSTSESVYGKDEDNG